MVWHKRHQVSELIVSESPLTSFLYSSSGTKLSLQTGSACLQPVSVEVDFLLTF